MIKMLSAARRKSASVYTGINSMSYDELPDAMFVYKLPAITLRA